MPTLFTKIINGEIPSYKIYEDEYTYAFLDIFPQSKGHALIVPKIEIDYFLDVPEPYYSAVFAAAKKLAPAIQKATKTKRIATQIIGVDVPHFHYHLAPIQEGQGSPFRGEPKKASEEELQEIQAKILENLE